MADVITVRFGDEDESVLERIRQLAAAERRALNTQVIILLEKALAERERKRRKSEREVIDSPRREATA